MAGKRLRLNPPDRLVLEIAAKLREGDLGEGGFPFERSSEDAQSELNEIITRARLARRWVRKFRAPQCLPLRRG